MISNSFIPILLTIAISVVLIFLYSLFKSLIPIYFVRFKEKKRYLKLMYFSEIIAGILALSLFIGYLYQRSTITALILLVVLLISVFFIGLFFIKDYVAGLIVKASNNYNVDDYIIINDIEGKILKFAQRSIIISAINSNKVFVPYSLLVGKIKSIKSTSEIRNNYNIELKISKEKDVEKTIKKLEKFIITLPWVNNSADFDIKIKQSEEDFYLLDIALVSFDVSYNLKIKNAIFDFCKDTII